MTRLSGNNGSLQPVLLVAGAAVFVIVLGLAALILFAGRISGSDDGPAVSDIENSEATPLPDYVLALDQDTQVAYRFALDRPDVMMWMPCYCGCGGHSGHRNARDCFIKPDSKTGDIQFEEHGSDCGVCVDIAVAARALTLQGKSLPETRAYVDETFSDIGPGTDTPLPPQ